MRRILFYLISFVLLLCLVSNTHAQIASNPVPADGSEYDETWAALGWTPGTGAASHNLYFGENSADVKNGIGDTFRGNQDTATFLVGFIGSPYPNGLAFDTTYYWRVDEVEADGITIHKGPVWSFTVIGQSARHPNPPDGGRFVELNAELNWSLGYGAIMHHMYFGTNSADVDAGTGGTDKGIVMGTTYGPGPLAKGTTYFWRVDEFDGLTTHKGNVWKFTTMPDIPIFDPNLVGWWKLDDEGTGTIIDYSGYNRNGSMHGDPQFVVGIDGDALEFDGDDYVTIDGYKGVVGSGGNTRAFSIAVWIRKEGPVGGDGEIIGWGSTGAGNRMEFRFNESNNRVRIESGGGNIQGDVDLTTGEWTHVAVTLDENPTYNSNEAVNFYFDGIVVNRANSDPDPIHPVIGFDVVFGREYNLDNERWFIGALDDVRLYDKVLSAEEVGRAMLGDPRVAWAPKPADGSDPFIEAATPLSWTPGTSAAQHDVYLGTSEMAVADADITDTTGIYRGRQDANSYNPPEILEFSETYYWRIDEVEADGTTIYRGRVSSFTIANFIVVDSFENYNDFPPDEIYSTWKDGFNDPTNGSQVGHLTAPYTEQVIVHGGSQAMPYFYDNSFGYSEATMTLSSVRDWTKHGVKALSLWFRGHSVSVGSFTEAPAGTYTLAARTVGNISGTSDEFHFAYQQLTGAGSITVKVNWVQDADDNAQAGVMIRDSLDPNSAHAAVLLETNDIAADADLLFQRRVIATGGSNTTIVDGIMAPQWLKVSRDLGGNFTASYSADGIAWTDIGGEVINMSAPIYIGLVVASENVDVTCTAEFSNVQIVGANGQWMNQDVGILSNDPEKIYVAIANSGGTPAVLYHDDPDAARINTWTQWNIDLKKFADQGVNLTNVNTISIGLGDKSNPQPGGAGQMFFDDIRLYRPRCMVELLKPDGDFNNDCVVDCLDLQTMASDWLDGDFVVSATVPDPAGLVVHYKFDGNANDSSGNNHHGIEEAGPTYVDGKFGQAIHLDGFDDYVAIPDVTYTGTGYPEVTACAWIRTTDENGQIVTFDRSENWRLEIGGSYNNDMSWYAGAPGMVGWQVYTSTGQVDTEQYPGWPANTGRVNDGKWHHLAGVFNNGTLFIYIDGTPREPYFGGSTFGYGRYTRYGFVGTGSEASYPPPTGRQNGPYLEGDLDEVRIYDRALSPAEIAYLADDTPGDGELYVPVPSMANLTDEEPLLSRSVNFKDFAVLADRWLNEQLWPEP